MLNYYKRARSWIYLPSTTDILKTNHIWSSQGAHDANYTTDSLCFRRYYEDQPITNASYFFFSPSLFKKTQIQLHSLKTTTLTINLSLFNIISAHFHRFGLPFNKGMYSSPVLCPKPLTHGRQPTLFVLQLLYSDKSSSNSADIHCCIPIHIFQPFMYANGHFTFCSQEFNHRTLSNMNINVSHFAMGCSAAVAGS